MTARCASYGNCKSSFHWLLRSKKEFWDQQLISGGSACDRFFLLLIIHPKVCSIEFSMRVFPGRRRRTWSKLSFKILRNFTNCPIKIAQWNLLFASSRKEVKLCQQKSRRLISRQKVSDYHRNSLPTHRSICLQNLAESHVESLHRQPQVSLIASSLHTLRCYRRKATKKASQESPQHRFALPLYFTSSCARGRNSITSSLDLDVNGCEIRLKTRVCLLSCITIDLFTNSEFQWNERTQIQLGKSFKKTFHGLSHIVRSYQPGADRRRLTVKWELLACRKWLLNLSRIIKLHNSPGSAIKVPQTLPHCDEIASGMWHRNSWRSH